MTLQPQNNSGETGTAILTETDDDKKTKVEVTVTGGPPSVAQPMHIHKGPCANLEPKPAYMLPAPTDGKSEGDT